MHPIPVIFQAGSYGTYLMWVLQMMFTDEKLYSPFDSTTGSSHRIKNIDSILIDTWLENHSCYEGEDFFRIHPKTNESHSLIDNAHKLTSYYKKSILVYPSKNTYLLHIHNIVFKLFNNLWNVPFRSIDRKNLYDNFSVEKDTPLEQVPPWIIRDWLSYDFFNFMNVYLEWYLPDQFSRSDCLIIFVDDLLYNLPETVSKVENFIGRPVLKDISSITEYHKLNLLLQKHLTQDKTASLVINAIKNQDTSLTWKPTDLSLITESYIRQWLRDSGYNFKCHGLNQFPTTSEELIKLL
jgi:hypothetical protein